MCVHIENALKEKAKATIDSECYGVLIPLMCALAVCFCMYARTQAGHVYAKMRKRVSVYMYAAVEENIPSWRASLQINMAGHRVIHRLVLVKQNVFNNRDK